MTYLLDSDVVADWLNGVPSAVQLVARLALAGLAISEVTYGEIHEGIYYGRDPKQAEHVFQPLLRSVDVLPLTRLIWRRFAHRWRTATRRPADWRA